VQYAAWIAPQKTVLLPCLHEELYAFMEPVRLLLAAVRAVLFLSPEEQAFAVDGLVLRLENTAVIGMGINEPPTTLPAIAKPDIPYLLLASRLEPAKNLALLYEYVQRYVEEGSTLQLQILGTGSFTPPEHPAFQLRGYLPHDEKLAWTQSALATCQPSLMESFSIVIMDSWQMGRPVLVNKGCAVTSGHVRRSGGGFTFVTYKDFANAVDWLQTHPTEAQQMGSRGQAYVATHYRWPIVFEKLVDLLTRSGISVSD
jgi:glycosyltransferase involved in cell wall biosynthesis